MDNKPQTPNIELPRPQVENAQGINVEQSVGSPESIVQPAQSLSQASDAVAQAIADSTVLTTPVVTSDDTSTSDMKVVPIVTDESDGIEKELIDKAKEIVSRTKTDPYSQSLEMSQFKNDYMKKRYGKEIKLPNELPQ